MKIPWTLTLLLAVVQGCSTQPKVGLSTPALATSPLGNLSIELPSFRSLEELKEFHHSLSPTDPVYVFENIDAKVAVLVVEWGSGDSWKALYIYQFDSRGHKWIPRVVWNTDARDVRVAFEKQTGEIEVRSAKGVPILTANIASFAGKPDRDW